MRPALYKCPNHIGCTVGYHGDDIEIVEGMVPVCSECGTALERVRRPRSTLVPFLFNAVVMVCIAIGAWLAWPTAVKLWKQLTTPPAEERK
jgi:hypothetical protein